MYGGRPVQQARFRTFLVSPHSLFELDRGFGRSVFVGIRQCGVKTETRSHYVMPEISRL